jgi:hypothetical protein
MQSNGIRARSSLSLGELKMQTNEVGILDVAKAVVEGNSDSEVVAVSVAAQFGEGPRSGAGKSRQTPTQGPSIDLTGERRLWTAVLVQAVVEWRSNNARARNAAEKFLFNSDEDFLTVCAGAGLNPSSFRAQLVRMRPRRETEHPQQHRLAA